MDITSLSEIRGVEDFVRRRIGQDGFSVDARFVRERTVSSDVIVEGDRYIHCLGNNVLQVPQFLEIVFAFDVFFVGGVHAGEKTADGGDSISFADTEDGGIDVGGTGFEGGVCVCNGAASVVVEVTFNVTGYNTSKRPYEIIDLSWVCTSNLLLTRLSEGTYSIGDTDTVYSDFVNGAVDRK